MGIEVIKDKCVGCGLCVKSCAYDAICLVEKLAVIDFNKCVLCGACVEACKFDAILIRKEEKSVSNLSQFSGILVVGEHRDGVIHHVTYELVSKARILADNLGVSVSCLIIGSGISQEDLNKVIFAGAEKIIKIDNDTCKYFNDELYSKIVTQVINEEHPEIVLTGATAEGRALIPLVAVALKTGLTADCTELAIDGERRLLLQTRPAFGGNIMATIICPNHRPQISTVRPKVMKIIFDEKRTGEIIDKSSISQTAKLMTILETVKEESTTGNIADADIIVSGGRGIGKPENFELLTHLAKLLNGAVGASRAAVDSGWIPYSHQVGQTGKTVGPKLYIACGISGAIQHQVGMRGSDFIVAINKDSSAPIFDIADLGIVGDLHEIIPEFIKILERN
ncbi:MAG: electron transfer flavoprotein subunit alpha [bacterium]|nr:electron transfer flavoprotein subunit alpha [bacterium]